MEENKNTVPETPATEVKEKESFIHKLARKEDEHKAKKAAKAAAKAAEDPKKGKIKKIGAAIGGGVLAVGAVAGTVLAVLSKKGCSEDEDYDPDYPAEEEASDPVDDPMDADE